MTDNVYWIGTATGFKTKSGGTGLSAVPYLDEAGVPQVSQDISYPTGYAFFSEGPLPTLPQLGNTEWESYKALVLCHLINYFFMTDAGITFGGGGPFNSQGQATISGSMLA